ncbi:transposase [Flavobacterium marginilacus]|uniref:transposase n=1 Tax=Flavobacterium marginilacus TaxID=3003256 RepID=UPI00248DC6E9|nr:transposase [Flavobacterium marginilacus]
MSWIINRLKNFDNRSTNASAESFNAKIKAFRSQLRGVRNVEFFLLGSLIFMLNFLLLHRFTAIYSCFRFIKNILDVFLNYFDTHQNFNRLKLCLSISKQPILLLYYLIPTFNYSFEENKEINI